ncbi:13901_t:CDS:2 [Gigaspora rosea]|nr:13901_t:CDS:2 [Gigaspora rosea]
MLVFWTLYFPSNERTIRTSLQKETQTRTLQIASHKKARRE